MVKKARWNPQHSKNYYIQVTWAKLANKSVLYVSLLCTGMWSYILDQGLGRNCLKLYVCVSHRTATVEGTEIPAPILNIFRYVARVYSTLQYLLKKLSSNNKNPKKEKNVRRKCLCSQIYSCILLFYVSIRVIIQSTLVVTLHKNRSQAPPPANCF